MLQIRCKNDLQKDEDQTAIVPFFTEVKEKLGIDFQQCKSFEEFKRKFIGKLTDEQLHQSLKLPGDTLKKEILEELRSRGVRK